MKRIDVAPAKLSESIAAFANTAGGKLFIGIAEEKEASGKIRSWRGFPDQEAANAHLQVVEIWTPSVIGGLVQGKSEFRVLDGFAVDRVSCFCPGSTRRVVP